MFALECCICGTSLIVKEYDRHRRKFCGSDKCNKEARRRAMARYRETDRGKAMVMYQNAKVKRPEKEYECSVCGNKFLHTRKRNTCDGCVKKMLEAGYKNPGLSVNMKKWRKKNPAKVKAHSVIGGIYRDRGYSTTRKREACMVCGEEKAEGHHHNYKKPRDVIFLCKNHHVELHSWDSN